VTRYRYRVCSVGGGRLGDFEELDKAVRLARELNAVVWKYIPPRGLWAKKVEIHAAT
jgi:hypothetical protein